MFSRLKLCAESISEVKNTKFETFIFFTLWPMGPEMAFWSEIGRIWLVKKIILEKVLR